MRKVPTHSQLVLFAENLLYAHTILLRRIELEILSHFDQFFFWAIQFALSLHKGQLSFLKIPLWTRM